MLHTQCFSYLFFHFICVHVERVTELAQTPTHSAQGSLNGTSFSTVSLTSFAMWIFFFIPCGPLRAQGGRGRRRKKEPWGLCTLSIVLIVERGGTWTVIPAENNTSFSPVKPSVRPHHREQALRIGDIISLLGKVACSLFLTTLHCGVVLRRWEGKGEKKRKKKTVTEQAQGFNVHYSALTAGVMPNIKFLPRFLPR